MSATPFSTAARGCVDAAAPAASAVSASEARAASWSPRRASAARSIRRAGELRRLLDAAPEDRVDVAGAGRCMPGIFTKPPSGIIPIPYSIPFRVRLTIAGGKPM